MKPLFTIIALRQMATRLLAMPPCAFSTGVRYQIEHAPNAMVAR